MKIRSARYLIIKASKPIAEKIKTRTSSKETVSITVRVILFSVMTHFTLITKTSRHVWSYQQINIHRLWGQLKVPGLHFQLVRKTYILQYFDFITNNSCDLNLQIRKIFSPSSPHLIHIWYYWMHQTTYLIHIYPCYKPDYVVTDKLIWHSKYNPGYNCTKYYYLSPFKVITSEIILILIKNSFD